MFHHLLKVIPKQLCALAHLGFTREAGTSYCLKSYLVQIGSQLSGGENYVQSDKYFMKVIMSNLYFLKVHFNLHFHTSNVSSLFSNKVRRNDK